MPKELSFDQDDTKHERSKPKGESFRLCGRLIPFNGSTSKFVLERIEGEVLPPTIVTTRFTGYDVSRGNSHWTVRNGFFGTSVRTGNKRLAKTMAFSNRIRTSTGVFRFDFGGYRTTVVTPDGKIALAFVPVWKDSEILKTGGTFYIQNPAVFGDEWPAVLVLIASRVVVWVQPTPNFMSQ